ncbi:PilZ domain-containing protein [Leisingera caerulea]|uniref:PilZ domain-containing protein n=1 Tax=Leisingera caerulea TaxID=506591 RepID=UPI0021A78E93|nr:PilZ domain-containing protein [Leisingera caerulea]UWQ82925.1 PilZ domain-containing protein [Leisingera caerulea]
MGSPISYFRTVIPSEPRLRLEMPCVIILSDGELEAKVYNISYGGFAVRLPEGQNTFELAKLQSIAIAGIGEFAIQARWRRPASLGLKFQSKRGARPLLDAFFARTGEYPT